MLVEVIPASITLSTGLAVVWPFFPVHTEHVHLQAALSREASPTQLTGKAILPSVREHVYLERSRLGVSPVAMWTLERQEFGVGVQVASQCTFQCEPERAVGAGMSSGAGMREQMLVERPEGNEGHGTLRTWKWPIARVRTLVDFQQ